MIIIFFLKKKIEEALNLKVKNLYHEKQINIAS